MKLDFREYDPARDREAVLRIMAEVGWLAPDSEEQERAHDLWGEVMISGATWQDVAKLARVIETRDIEAKGFDGPVRIHRVDAMKGA